MVANKSLDEVEIKPEIREKIVVMCQHFHQSVSNLSKKFYETMGRINYVTPTSYLELIKTFKILLNKKQMEIITSKDRYSVGLEKLEFSNNQVSRCFGVK